MLEQETERRAINGKGELDLAAEALAG